MKHRIRSWLLGVILALPLFAPFTAYADTATLYLSPASGSVSKGKVLPVTLRVNSGNEPVNAIQANLSYPANLLDVVSIKKASAWDTVAENSYGNGSIRIARGALPASTGDKAVAVIEFRAKTDSGTANVNFTSGSAVISANTNKDVKSGERGGSYTLKPVTVTPTAPEPPKDTIPPKISKVEATEITATTAVITWTTSEPATSEVNFGISQGYGIAAVDTNTVTEHKVTLSSPLIIPGTKYHYMVKSVDPAGNAVSSPDATFTTIGATLEAKVVNQSNKPVPGAQVTFGEVTGKTDKNGKVTLKNLPLGKQTGTVTYKNKQAPATVQLDTLLDKNGKPHSATFKIDVSSDLWLRVLVLLLLIALAGAFLYRRGRGSRGPGEPGAGANPGGFKDLLAKIVAGLKSLPKRLKGLLPKKEINTSTGPDNPPPSVAPSSVIHPTAPTPNIAPPSSASDPGAPPNTKK